MGAEIKIDIEWAKKMLAAEIECYLYYLWNNDIESLKHYEKILSHYTYTFRQLHIPIEIVFDFEWSRLPQEIPIGFSICGEKTNIFYETRREWEANQKHNSD